MKQSLKLMIPLLILILLLSACEISNPQGAADIEATPSNAGQPVTPATGDTPLPPTEEPPPPDNGEISAVQLPASTTPDTPPVPGSMIVKLVTQAAMQARGAELGSDGIVTMGVPSIDQTMQELGVTNLQPIIEPVAESNEEPVESLTQRVSVPVNQLYMVEYDADIPPEEAANVVAQDPGVEFAEPNYVAGITAHPVYVPASLTPNDPYFSYQWHLENIQMPAAWDRSTGENTIVAIVDTGVDFGGSDLANTNHLPGYDFANQDPDPTDDQGHGTHVAGTIAQSTNNGVGVAGVAYNTTLLPVKVLGSNGQGSYENIIQGIIYAVDQGADVINLSLAGRTGSQALQEAIQYAYERNVVVVAAAGNSNGPVEFPAAYDRIIAVGSVRFDNTRAPYSNFGPQIDVMAPGGDTNIDQNQDGYGDGVLQQTFKSPGAYTYLFLEGTSMASPHVAGVAALLRSVKQGATVDEIKTVLMQTARNIGPADQFGSGVIQAADALAAITGQPLPPTDTPTPVQPEPATDTPTPVPPQPVTDTPTPVQPEPVTDTPTPVQPAPATDTPIPPVPDTPTPTPVQPLPPGELLTNSGFEADEGWVFGDTPIRGGYDTEVVLSGQRSARLGAVSGPNVVSFSSAWQRVAIPAEANRVVLNTNVYPVSQDECMVDLQYTAILDANFRMIKRLSIDLSNSQTWENYTYDISDLRGQTVYVYFSVYNRACSGLTAMYVDDVSLRWE